MRYTIRSDRETGTITYHCSTTKMAFEKFKDFQRAEYLNITIDEGNEQYIPESKLLFLLNASHAEALHP